MFRVGRLSGVRGRVRLRVRSFDAVSHSNPGLKGPQKALALELNLDVCQKPQFRAKFANSFNSGPMLMAHVFLKYIIRNCLFYFKKAFSLAVA